MIYKRHFGVNPNSAFCNYILSIPLSIFSNLSPFFLRHHPKIQDRFFFQQPFLRLFTR